MFLMAFSYVARALHLIMQSRDNNNWPNKNNDVITDLGGEGNFPMFRFGPALPPASTLVAFLVFLSNDCAHGEATDF